MREAEIERRFVKEIRRSGGQALKFVSPGMAGVPDRIVLLPGGKVFFAEIKRPGEKLRPLQEKRKRDLEELGFKVEVVDSTDRIKEVCRGIRPA